MRSLFVMMVCLLMFTQSAVAETSSYGIKGYALSSVIWDDTRINACWEDLNDSTKEERKWVQDIIRDTWEDVSDVNFVGWGECKENTKGVRIKVSDEKPHVESLGNKLDGKKNGMTLNFTYNNWSTSCKGNEQRCSEVIAVHEFGHALGFSHEQNRPDTPSSCTDAPQGTNGDTMVGAWDIDSVMNYCNPNWNGNGQLSDTDIDMVQRFYGPFPVSCINTYISGWNDVVFPVANTDGKANQEPYRCRGYYWVDTRGKNWNSSCSTGPWEAVDNIWGDVSCINNTISGSNQVVYPMTNTDGKSTTEPLRCKGKFKIDTRGGNWKRECSTGWKTYP